MGVTEEANTATSTFKPRFLELFTRPKSVIPPISHLGVTRTPNNSQPQYLSPTVELHAETRLNSAILTLSVCRSGILAGCDDGSIFLLTADLSLVRAFPSAHRGACTSVEWHLDGIHFVSSGSDRTVRIWSINSSNGSGTQPLLAIAHSCEVTAACFDPRCISISDSQPSSIWLFTCGLDNRLRFWRGSLLEQYESLGCVPVSLVAKLEGDQTAIYVGTGDGRVLVYGFSRNSFGFLNEALVRNRNGKFSSGVSVIGIALINGQLSSDCCLLVTTADHRLRYLLNADAKGTALEAVGKFKGLVNTGGFKGFVVSGGGRSQFIVSGSECGHVFIWPRESSEKEKTSEAWESFLVAEKPEKLTALSAAPWNPETSDMLPLCVVAGTSEGGVRVFYNRQRKQTSTRKGECDAK